MIAIRSGEVISAHKWMDTSDRNPLTPMTLRIESVCNANQMKALVSMSGGMQSSAARDDPQVVVLASRCVRLLWWLILDGCTVWITVTGLRVDSFYRRRVPNKSTAAECAHIESQRKA